jgi:hypothetical protein
MAHSRDHSLCHKLFSGEEAKAEYSNGVLRVTLPKREEAKSGVSKLLTRVGTAAKTIEAKPESSKSKASSGS